MRNLLARFWKEEDGMGTVEIVIIVAVLVGIALIFRGAISDAVTKMTNDLFGEGNREDWVDTTGKGKTDPSGGGKS